MIQKRLGVVITILLICELTTACYYHPSSAVPDNVMNSISLNLDAARYRINTDATGLSTIEMEGFPNASSAGEPMLPHKVYNILLPPDVIWSSLALDVVSNKISTIEGLYDIKPGVLDSAQDNAKPGGDGQIVKDRNIRVYGTNANFPARCVTLLPYSQMRKWKFTRVDFAPFQYNPVTKKLTLSQGPVINIVYKRSAAKLDSSLMNDTSMDDVAAKTFFNFDQGKGWYEKTK